MEFNFTKMQDDQMERVNKRLESLKKSFIKEYMTSVELNDIIARAMGLYTGCLDRINNLLVNSLA